MQAEKSAPPSVAGAFCLSAPQALSRLRRDNLHSPPHTPTVVLMARALLFVQNHARRAQPRECCGILLGTPGDAECPTPVVLPLPLATRIDAAAPITNVARHLDRFELDPLQMMHAERQARHAGLSIVGYYHSHTRGPAQPSPADLAGCLWPDLVPRLHLIVAPTEAAVWLWDRPANDKPHAPAVRRPIKCGVLLSVS